MTITTRWSGTATAMSSIAHGGDTRGTITMLRREIIVQPDGSTTEVPIISGNSLRGLLRRVGEELLRDTLDYAGELPLSALHALRAGGALAKTSAGPLSGAALAELRELVPHIGIFGTAAGGRIIDGCLQVGKLVPHLAETAHITGIAADRTAFTGTQLETYTRLDDTTRRKIAASTDTGQDSQPMLYRIETFPAGTPFSTWLQITRATPVEAAFFRDVLATFSAAARIGGRAAIGHGQLQLDLTSYTLAGEQSNTDWRDFLDTHRSRALAALASLT